MRDRVWAVGELGGAVAATTTEVEGPDERGGTGGDVDGSSAGELRGRIGSVSSQVGGKSEATHVKDAVDVAPSSRVPGPARDRVVDNGRPEEANDEDGEKAGALGDTSDGLRVTIVSVTV